MDTIWALRQGYETARKIKASQDDFCAKAQAGLWNELEGDFPDDLQWEALVDVLRGRVKIHNHCYEAVDLDGIVRLTNEFKFSIAAFHHAHETYLVPDLLKKAYGHPPAVALFATNGRYKREAYRGSEFAPRILADNGLNVVMKDMTQVIPSFLIHVKLLTRGVDVVIWDSHPLALGATPKQVYIDGIPQLASPHTVIKPESFQRVPKTPNFDKEAADAVKFDGLPPLAPAKLGDDKTEFVIFSNVSSMYRRSKGRVEEIFSAAEAGGPGVVVVKRGKVICSGSSATCASFVRDVSAEEIDLEGGSLAPGLLSYGSPLGLQEIQGESSTYDGVVIDPLTGKVPEIIGGDDAVIRAVDGLQFATRDAYLAYRYGVVSAVVAPKASGFLAGLGTAFRTGAAHKLIDGAVIQDITALHVQIGHVGVPSVSTQIAALRRLLLGGAHGELGSVFAAISDGKLPLVISVQNADAMASIINLKKEVEEATNKRLRITFAGGLEAHLIATEIGQAGIGVILAPSRPFPGAWEERRILPGPPLSKDTAVSVLLNANVTVGIGIQEQWGARNTRLDVAWAALDAGGEISKADAIALASVNLERLLGVQADLDADNGDLVVTKAGSILDMEAKVAGIISARSGGVFLV
ncbi:hypothetical protein HGRIS_002672 [Hohenbuehelia grisea]|uniref:Uncharacterized protein n=1 Tax=Hohenbuehelia grisea TaxID=104357 RepID=A0ABR3JNA8_9AGAR